ncbi:50S ribosomal protein L32 [Candidatus Nomurabacteria bacterium]|nr:50S ribosomal protein L32 [Candidatus Nomurabacteria bacterium]
MSVPVKKKTRTKTGMRRSHHALKGINVSYDEQGNPQLPHRANPTTGMYKGKKVVDTEKRVERRVKKLKKFQ